MSDIFISYAKEDVSKAQQLADALIQHGWTVWFDRYIPAGKKFHEVIEKELIAAKCVLVLWSKNSIYSEWVIDEANEAKDKKTYLPILIENVKMPMGLRMIQAVNLINWKEKIGDDIFNILKNDIEAYTGVPKTNKIDEPVSKPSDLTNVETNKKDQIVVYHKNFKPVEGLDNRILIKSYDQLKLKRGLDSGTLYIYANYFLYGSSEQTGEIIPFERIRSITYEDPGIDEKHNFINVLYDLGSTSSMYSFGVKTTYEYIHKGYIDHYEITMKEIFDELRNLSETRKINIDKNKFKISDSTL